MRNGLFRISTNKRVLSNWPVIKPKFFGFLNLAPFSLSLLCSICGIAMSNKFTPTFASLLFSSNYFGKLRDYLGIFPKWLTTSPIENPLFKKLNWWWFCENFSLFLGDFLKGWFQGSFRNEVWELRRPPPPHVGKNSETIP